MMRGDATVTDPSRVALVLRVVDVDALEEFGVGAEQFRL
jgi:hypothetical protein